MVGVVVVMMVIDELFNDGWIEKAEREATELGLPPHTHQARKWGRIVSVQAVDPDTGKWLWKAHRG